MARQSFPIARLGTRTPSPPPTDQEGIGYPPGSSVPHGSSILFRYIFRIRRKSARFASTRERLSGLRRDIGRRFFRRHKTHDVTPPQGIHGGRPGVVACVRQQPQPFLPESSSNNRRPRSGGMTSSFSATTTATGPMYSLRFRTLSYLSRVIHFAGKNQNTDCAMSGSVSQGVINTTPATGACFDPATADATPHPNDSPSRYSGPPNCSTAARAASTAAETKVASPNFPGRAP